VYPTARAVDVVGEGTALKNSRIRRQHSLHVNALTSALSQSQTATRCDDLLWHRVIRDEGSCGSSHRSPVGRLSH